MEQDLGIKPEQFPYAVVQTDDYLKSLGVWHIVTQNENGREAEGCADAADMRQRLGEPGIPLWDEMKTLLVRGGTDKPGEYVMIHCRGDRELEPEKIEGILGYRPRIFDIEKEKPGDSPAEIDRKKTKASSIKAEAEEIAAELDMEFGLVNPFSQIEGKTVHHIFDEDLLKPLGTIGSVMTNAADPAWAVEFYAAELFRKLPNTTSQTNISRTDSSEKERPRWITDPQHIGIITGNSPESGALLWLTINQKIRKALGKYALAGDIVMPRFSVESLPELGMTMEIEQRHEQILPPLLKLVKELCERDVKLITVACNTTPYFTKEIREITDEHGARFVSMPEEVGNWLVHNPEVQSVDFVAAGPVARLKGGWSAYAKPLKHLKEVRTPNQETIEYIDELARDVKAEGANYGLLSKLTNIFGRFKEDSYVVVALTEMAQLLAIKKPKHKDRVKIINALGICSEVVTHEYVFGDKKPIEYEIIKP